MSTHQNYNLEVLICFVFLSVFFPVFILAAGVAVSPATAIAGPSSQFTISVNISSVANFFGATFDLIFNPSVLSFVSVQKGTFLEQGGTATDLLTNIDTPGDLIVGYSRQAVDDVATGISGSGTLMNIVFNTLASVGTSSLVFQNNALCDPTGENCNVISAAWSNGLVSVVSTPPADTIAPTIPANLSATAASSTQINLTWTASTDNVGVAGYKIYRNGVQTGTSATNSYSDIGLTASTAYTYTVSAYDAAGNNSGQSTSASATTQGVPDTTAPTVPANLTATAVSSTQINLSWTASTDNVGVVGYHIYRNDVEIATTATNSYSNTGLTPSTSYTYKVSAYDAASNGSFASGAASATTQTPINQAPVVSAGSNQTLEYPITTAYLSGTATDDGLPAGSTFSISWSKVSGIGGVTFANSTVASTTAAFSSTGTYILRLSATDGTLTSTSNATITITADTGAPVRSNGSPTGTLASNTTSATVSFTTNENATCYWSNFANTSIDLMPNAFTTTGGTTHSLSRTDLSAGSYSYYAKCRDANGNPNTADYPILFSIASSAVTTSGGGGGEGGGIIDTTKPVVFISSSLVEEKKVTANATTTLTAAASDNVGVAGVRFYVNGIAVDTEKTTFPFTANWVPSSGTSTIVAVARDSSGNYSTSSPVSIFVLTPPVVVSQPVAVTPPVAVPASAVFTKYLYLGTRNEETKKLQEYLAKDKEIYPLGLITGYYGLLTQTAVQKFQCKYSIVCSGTPETTGYGSLGSKTRQKLNEIYGNQAVGKISLTKDLYLGLRHEEVSILQQYLSKDKELYPEAAVTGYYGPLTQKAVRRFQCKYKIVCSGTIETTGYGSLGPKTRAKLNELNK